VDIGFCPRCGTRREPGMGFCTRCGTNLAEVDAALALPPRETEGSSQAEPAVEPVHPPPPAPVTTPRDEGWATTEAFPAAPQSSFGVPGPRHASARRRSAASLRPFALIGGVLGVVGALLPWARFHFDRNAFAFPAKFLFNGTAGGRSVSVGLVLVALSVLGLVLSPFSAASLPRRILGVLVLAVPVAFALQGLGHADASHVFSVLGPGAYVAALGGLLLLFG
jgi:hypothetical protein